MLAVACQYQGQTPPKRRFEPRGPGLSCHWPLVLTCFTSARCWFSHCKWVQLTNHLDSDIKAVPIPACQPYPGPTQHETPYTVTVMVYIYFKHGWEKENISPITSSTYLQCRTASYLSSSVITVRPLRLCVRLSLHTETKHITFYFSYYYV